MRALANEGLASTPPASPTDGPEVEEDVDRRGPSSSIDHSSNNPLLLRPFTFDDDDDPGSLSVGWVPLELEFGTEVGDTFKGFEIDAAAFSAAALSALFKNGLSSSAKSYSGEGSPRGTEIGNDLTAAAAAILDLPPDGRK